MSYNCQEPLGTNVFISVLSSTGLMRGDAIYETAQPVLGLLTSVLWPVKSFLMNDVMKVSGEDLIGFVSQNGFWWISVNNLPSS